MIAKLLQSTKLRAHWWAGSRIAAARRCWSAVTQSTWINGQGPLQVNDRAEPKVVLEHCICPHQNVVVANRGLLTLDQGVQPAPPRSRMHTGLARGT